MTTKIIAVITYLLMIGVNGLANALPINNLNTGQISDAYPNLFAPAGMTFAIWGVIYLLLGVYSVVQLVVKNVSFQGVAQKVNKYFIFTSVINVLWIFAWHYLLVGLSVLLMLALLASLIKIADIIRGEKLTLFEKTLIKVPFGIYFGWITVATIANITALLVGVGWKGFGISEALWTIIILGVGTLISIWRMIYDRNIAYGLVPVWAYLGIWFKHASLTGFNGMYPQVILATQICLIGLILANGYVAAIATGIGKKS